MSNRIRYSILLVSALALAGCHDYSETPQMKGNPQTQAGSVSAAQAALKSGNRFNDVIAKSYYDMASVRQANKDFVDADFFARKSLEASKGDMVSPEDNKRWAIMGQGDMQTRTQMDQQRNRLLAALDGGGRTRFPALAASAQVSYDCWVERTEQNFQAGWHGDCYNKYLSDIAQLEAALRPQSTAYNVYFDFGSSKLNAAGMQAVRDAAAQSKAGTQRYRLVGHADTTGANASNVKLSRARGDAVRAALVKAGVPANTINVDAVGEQDLPVSTADNVKESKNRVVQIYVSP